MQQKLNVNIGKTALIAGLVLGLFSAAMAQRSDRRSDPEYRAAIASDRENLNRAGQLVKKARIALRQSQWKEVQELCDQAAYIYRVVGEEFAAPAREVLAECAVAQKKYSNALLEIRSAKIEGGTRLRMTEALALIGLNRLPEAEKLIAREVGSVQAPTDFRRSNGLWELAIDRVRSAESFTSTALVIRATARESEDSDALFDVEQAALVVPDNATTELRIGDCLFRLMRYDESIPHFLNAKRLGQARTARIAKQRHESAVILKDIEGAKKPPQATGGRVGS